VWLADWLIHNNPNKPSVMNANVIELWTIINKSWTVCPAFRTDLCRQSYEGNQSSTMMNSREHPTRQSLTRDMVTQQSRIPLFFSAHLRGFVLHRLPSVAPPGGKGGSFPLWVDVQKLCNMCVLSLSWNFFVSHDKYIARPSRKEPRWYTDYTTGTGGLHTLDPL